MFDVGAVSGVYRKRYLQDLNDVACRLTELDGWLSLLECRLHAVLMFRLIVTKNAISLRNHYVILQGSGRVNVCLGLRPSISSIAFETVRSCHVLFHPALSCVVSNVH